MILLRLSPNHSLAKKKNTNKKLMLLHSFLIQSSLNPSNYLQAWHIKCFKKTVSPKTNSNQENCLKLTHTPETQIEPSCFKLNDTAFHWDIIDGSHNILKIF